MLIRLQPVSSSRQCRYHTGTNPPPFAMSLWPLDPPFLSHLFCCQVKLQQHVWLYWPELIFLHHPRLSMEQNRMSMFFFSFKKFLNIPVYPQRVTRQFEMPATVVNVVCIKFKPLKLCSHMSCNAATAFGPCTAINACSSGARNVTSTFFPEFREQSTASRINELSTVFRDAFETTYNNFELTFMTIKSSMMPPFVVVNTVSVPEFSANPCISAVHNFSKHPIASDPRTYVCSICETSKIDAAVRVCKCELVMLTSLYCTGKR